MKKNKLLTSAICTIALTGPLAVSCSHTSKTDKLASDILVKAVNEFVEIAKNPRPTFYMDKIRPYLINKAKELGYTTQQDTYGNIWFDVPATEGYESYNKLILQGHMDMVVDGLTKEAAKTTPIEVEYHEEEQTLTSKGKQTSLGSDNGIGIGTILSLIQNKDVKHGPIRVLLTADEEDGMVGATNLDPSALDTDYLISLDGELPQEGYYRSCQGGIKYTFTQTFTTEQSTKNPYYIKLNGFKGGHSGNEINLGRGNALVVLFAILNKLSDAQVISYDHINDKGEDVPPANNSIPKTGRIGFATTKSATEIETAITETITQYKSIYPGEDWDNVSIKILSEKPALTKCISLDDSNKIVKCLTNCDGDGLMFGTFIADPESKRPLCSANLSPLSIKEGKLTLESYARSVSKDGMNLLNTVLPSRWHNHFTSTPTRDTFFYPWERKDDDKIQKLSDDAYRSIGITPTIRDTNGGVEPTMFCVKRPTIHQTALGTKIVGAHTTEETCYLQPLKNTIKVLLYIFDRMKF